LDWTTAIHFARRFARLVLERSLPPDVDVLNVNVPVPATKATPCRLTRLSRQSYFTDRVQDPTSASRIGDARCCYGYDEKTLEPDSDIAALRRGLVSVTAVSLDLTSLVSLESMGSLLGL
jgi:5'-nucleotidase